MNERPLSGNPDAARIRRARLLPVGNEAAYQPVVRIVLHPESGPVAEGVVWDAHGILLAAGFRESPRSVPGGREYLLASNGSDHDMVRCAEAIAALSAIDHPVNVDGRLLGSADDLLPHLSTAALITTIEGLGARPGESTVDTLAYCLLDSEHGLLARVHHTLDTLARRPLPGDPHPQNARVRRAAILTDPKIHLARLPRQTVDAYTPAPTTASGPGRQPTPFVEAPTVVIRDNDGLIVVDGADHATGQLLDRAGFDTAAFVDDRHQLPFGAGPWLIQRICTRALRRLVATGRDVDIDPALLADRNLDTASLTGPALADIVDRLVDDDRTNHATVRRLILDPDGTMHRLQEHLDELAGILTDHCAPERARNVRITARLVGAARAHPAPDPQPPATRPTRDIASSAALSPAAAPSTTDPRPRRC